MGKKKFLFDSLSGLIGDIAWQVSKEGHEVRYCMKDQNEADIADGFVAKPENPEKDADWADITVFDDTLGQGEKAQAGTSGVILIVVGLGQTMKQAQSQVYSRIKM
jgi:hypothetical protein